MAEKKIEKYIKTCKNIVLAVYLFTSPGLTMTLNIDQDNYVYQAGSMAGVRVTILDQNLMPFPVDDGVTASPGYTTDIAVSQVWKSYYTLFFLFFVVINKGNSSNLW